MLSAGSPSIMDSLGMPCCRGQSVPEAVVDDCRSSDMVCSSRYSGFSSASVYAPGWLGRYRGANVNFVRVWLRSGGFFEAHRANELVEIVDDALVEPVELGLLVGL